MQGSFVEIITHFKDDYHVHIHARNKFYFGATIVVKHHCRRHYRALKKPDDVKFPGHKPLLKTLLKGDREAP